MLCKFGFLWSPSSAVTHCALMYSSHKKTIPSPPLCMTSFMNVHLTNTTFNLHDLYNDYQKFQKRGGPLQVHQQDLCDSCSQTGGPLWVSEGRKWGSLLPQSGGTTLGPSPVWVSLQERIPCWIEWYVDLFYIQLLDRLQNYNSTSFILMVWE